jgi:hypothetical protein
MSKAIMTTFNKYKHYENSVQTPEEHVRIFERMFFDIRRKEALKLREDFCGTFMISCEWVKSHAKRTAVGVDLDPEPLDYGMKNSYKKLKPEQKKRVKLLKEDVCVPTQEKAEVIGAGNFSFNIFKTKAQMKKYFKGALKSLTKDGIFVLEMAGGPGFIVKGKEQKTYTVPGLGKFTYYWDQQTFDPITHEGMYAIHFRDRKGVMHRNVFTYDWRIWSIPELREMMEEVGFKSTKVYWEDPGFYGDGTGDYVAMESGDNAYAWIAFVVGIK